MELSLALNNLFYLYVTCARKRVEALSLKPFFFLRSVPPVSSTRLALGKRYNDRLY